MSVFKPLLSAAFLYRVLAGGNCENHPVCDDRRIGMIETAGYPDGLKCWILRLWVRVDSERHDTTARAVAICNWKSRALRRGRSGHRHVKPGLPFVIPRCR